MANNKDKIVITLTFDRDDIDDIAARELGFGSLTDKQFKAIKKNMEESQSYIHEILNDNGTITNLIEEILEE